MNNDNTWTTTMAEGKQEVGEDTALDRLKDQEATSVTSKSPHKRLRRIAVAAWRLS